MGRNAPRLPGTYNQGTGYRAIEIFFHPTGHGFTGVEVLTVDYRGDRRVARRIGSIRLGVGRDALVGLTPGEVTTALVDHLHTWLSEERSTIPGRQAPAPPEGVTGAVVEARWTQPTLNLALTV